MGAEDFVPSIESSDGAGNSAEKSQEAAEKARTEAKKSAAGIARTQKDEKKAKKYDLLLAGFLVKIIVDKKYDFILVKLLKALDFGYTSNFVLGILSLINIDISNRIREHNRKKLINFKYKADKIIAFDDKEFPKEVRTRINYWIEDIIDSVTLEYSSIQTEKIISCLENDVNGIINDYISDILAFFLKDINIIIREREAQNIAAFVISEVLKALKKLKLEEI